MNASDRTVIAGRYEIEDEIGRGGFATVYRARDRNAGRLVALKVIHGNFAGEARVVQRFRQEARMAARLRHPNIVDLYDVGDEGGTLYLVMPLIGEGRTLRGWLDERGSLPLEEALPILLQVAGALTYVHAQRPPLVHRDLKPANLLLESRGARPVVLLSDFGLVRSMAGSTQLTGSGETLGTMAYMAPEQIEPQTWGEITPATDVYALGVVAYEMLVGQTPFGREMGAMNGHLHDAPPDPRESAPDLNDDLAEARTTQALQATALADLLAQADAARESGEWLQMQQCCVQIMQLDCAHPGVMQMMAEATAQLQQQNQAAVQRRQMAEQYREAVEACDDARWEEAVAILERLSAADADFRDVRQRLDQARAELRCVQQYAQAIAHGGAGKWPAACRAWLEVLRLHPGDREGESLAQALDAMAALLDDVDVL